MKKPRRPPRRRRAASSRAGDTGGKRPKTATYVDIANDYARRVASGKQIAGKWTRLAAQRHLRDLARQGTAEFPYVFHSTAADRICLVAERLPHIKGPKAGQLFKLEPWECFFLCSIFGWLLDGTLTRRFKRFYLEVARGNGKSFLLSIIALFMLAVDGEAGAEIYSAAKTRDQAKVVFRVAQEIARKSPAFRQFYGVDVNAHSIVQTSSASSFVALASDDTALDGLNIHFAAIDELHAHPTRAVYDVLETAIGKRDQPLLGIITTAGADRTGICYEIRSDLVKILNGTEKDESFFGVIYTIDADGEDGDDWRDETCWPKANPNLNVSVNLSTLRDLAKKAERTPAAQAAFKTKHLDVWVGANAALYNLEDWSACADPELSEEQFEGEEVIFSHDFATKDDIAPRCDVFRREVEGIEHFYVFSHNYIGRTAVDDGRNASYPGWEIEGRLLVSDMPDVDLMRIEEDVVADGTRYQVLEVAYDPWQATGFAQRLLERGAPVVEVPMNAKSLSEATKELGSLMRSRRIHHDGDPVLAFAIGNVVGHFDNKENVYPRKERPENKIDPAVALIINLSRWLTRGNGALINESPVSFV